MIRIKATVLSNPGSCLNRAAPDEPIFVLRAKDPLFAPTIRLWAAMAQGQNVHALDKVDDALMVASSGEEWQHMQPAPPSEAGRAIGGASMQQNRSTGPR